MFETTLDNFYSVKEEELYLIDFGMAKKFRDEDGKHKEKGNEN